MFWIHVYPYFFDNPCIDFNFLILWAIIYNLINDNNKAKHEKPCWKTLVKLQPLHSFSQKKFSKKHFFYPYSCKYIQVLNLHIMKNTMLALSLSLSLIYIFKRNVCIQVFVFDETLMHVGKLVYMHKMYYFYCIICVVSIYICMHINVCWNPKL